MMLRRLALILPLLSLIFASVTVTHAANAVVGTGNAGSCTETALRNAATTLNSGGGTMTFNCGGAPHTIVMTQQLSFNGQNTTYIIDGGGLITLDGNEQTRILYTASGRNLSMTVRNIALINGRANTDPASERAQNQGGAIYSGYNNTLLVQHVTFTNNRAAGNYHEYHGGGAIAIDTTSVATIEDSVFTDNRSPNGGAINNLLSRLTITRSVFRDNRATSDNPGGGGAIYNDAGKLTISSSHILNNYSANLGGGIFSWAHNVNGSYSGKTKITNTVLDGNSAAAGGGLWKGGAYVLELKNSSVTNNTAVDVGGGLSGTGPGVNFKIVNSTIAYNRVTTTGSAAGIFSANNRSTVLNSTIAFNTVPNDAQSVGAAIHGDVKVTNTILVGNTGGWNGVWSCMGSITNGGQNLQHPSNTCGGGIPVRDALLETTLQPALATLPLGQTQFLMMTNASTAINAGANCPSTDQRGVPRPQGTHCDIGAVEKEGSAPAAPMIVAPVNGATGVPLVPTIQWQGSGATSYKLKIIKTDGTLVFSAVVNEACTTVCSYPLTNALKPNKKYKLILEARSIFGKTKTKIKFTTGG